MKVKLEIIAKAMFLGLGASLFMDFALYLSSLLFDTKTKDYAILGRWIFYVFDGVFMHESIRQSNPVSHELILGWLVHLSVGIFFACLFLQLSNNNWLGKPTLLTPLVFSTATIVFPFFILQPSMGAGVIASNTPEPWVARFNSLFTHILFGIGLYVTAILLSKLRSQ